MSRVGWVVVVLLFTMGVGALADCGCQPGLTPECYATFRTNELVAFSLTVPVEYFMVNNTSQTPMITGWRVEDENGAVVRSVAYAEPAGHWKTFFWDLTDDNGFDVEPGFYRIFVATTSAGEAAVSVRLISCCTPCVCCSICCSTSICVDGRIRRCPTEFGDPYIVLSAGGTKRCCGLTVQLFGEVVIEP